MCMIVYKPAGEDLPSPDRLGYIWFRNDDGSGYVFPRDNELIVRKGHKSFNSFYDSIRRDFDRDKPYILHFRIRTSGETSQRTCHPFLVNRQVALAHNGILYGYRGKVTACSTTKGSDSDTLQFVKMLRGLPKNWFYNSSIKAILEESLGASKVALMSNTGDIVLLNGRKGTWDTEDKCWYSHAGYRQTTTYLTGGWSKDDDSDGDSYYYDERGQLKRYDTKKYSWSKKKKYESKAKTQKEKAKEHTKAFLDNKEPATTFLCGDCLHDGPIDTVTAFGACPECGGERLMVSYESEDIN